MFRKLQLSDKKLFDKYLYNKSGLHSMYSFTNIFMWQDDINPEVCEIDGFLCTKFTMKENTYAAFPVGEGDAALPIKKIIDSENVIFICLNDDMKSILSEKFPDRFEFVENRANYDYVYLTEKLISLKGRKLHSKRNHIKIFAQAHSYEYKHITPDLLDVCMDIEKKWISEKGMSPDCSEFRATSKLIENFEYLGCSGGILYADGVPCACSIGEMMSYDTAIIHMEKAVGNINGAYPMINRLTCENEFYNSKYINREEDMGLESLRKAKLSYHPDLMIMSDRARLKNEC